MIVKYLDSNKYYPNDKYMFLREAIIHNYAKYTKNDIEPDYHITEYMKFLEDMYQVYCKFKEGEN